MRWFSLVSGKNAGNKRANGLNSAKTAKKSPIEVKLIHIFPARAYRENLAGEQGNA